MLLCFKSIWDFRVRKRLKVCSQPDWPHLNFSLLMAQIRFFPLGNLQMDEQSACEIIYRTRARLPPGCSQVAQNLPTSCPQVAHKLLLSCPQAGNTYAQVALLWPKYLSPSCPQLKIFMVLPWLKIFMPMLPPGLPMVFKCIIAQVVFTLSKSELGRQWKKNITLCHRGFHVKVNAICNCIFWKIACHTVHIRAWNCSERFFRESV